MRRGGYGKEAGDQPDKESVKVTPITRVLHPLTRVVIGVLLTAGGVWTLFTWDWRYVAAGLMTTLGGIIVGPWVWPRDQVRIEVDPNYRPNLGNTDTFRTDEPRSP